MLLVLPLCFVWRQCWGMAMTTTAFVYSHILYCTLPPHTHAHYTQGLTLRRARLCATTTMQTLPPDIRPVSIPRVCTEGLCDVCGEDAEFDGNHLLQCDKCGCMVHTECYSVQHRPDGRLWLCDVCRLGLKTPPPCALCPVVGGIMKPTTCGRWVHCACALWVPETCPVTGDAEVQAREDVGICGMVTDLDQVRTSP